MDSSLRRDNGPVQGDFALASVATVFEKSLEKTINTPGQNIVAAKYGGEEFCAIITGYTGSRRDLYRSIEFVRESINNLRIKRCSDLTNFKDENYSSISITIAAGLRNKFEPVNDLIVRVDSRLNLAKKQNKRNESFVV